LKNIAGTSPHNYFYAVQFDKLKIKPLMKTKAIILMMALMLGAATLGMAQNHGCPMNRDARVEQLKHDLNLTDQQEKQWQTLFKGFTTERDAVWQDSTLTRDQRFEKMQDLREKHRGEIEKILTPEQIEKWDSIRANRPMRMGRGDRGPQGRGPGNPEDRGKMMQQRVAFDKELSAGEKATIAECRAQLEAVRKIAENHQERLKEMLPERPPMKGAPKGPGPQGPGEQGPKRGPDHEGVLFFLLMDPARE